MPEIDPQSDPRLTDALRRMAASSRQGAPAEIGAGLAEAFRRHHTRRRRIRMAGAAAIVACMALVASLISTYSAHRTPGAEQARHEISNAPGKPPDVMTPVVNVTTSSRAAIKRNKPKVLTSRAASRQFLALPGYDPAVPADELHVVRVRLPASALWQMGAPMSPDGDGRRVLADFVVSQDGTPYAVRLVQ